MTIFARNKKPCYSVQIEIFNSPENLAHVLCLGDATQDTLNRYSRHGNQVCESVTMYRETGQTSVMETGSGGQWPLLCPYLRHTDTEICALGSMSHMDNTSSVGEHSNNEGRQTRVQRSQSSVCHCEWGEQGTASLRTQRIESKT